MSRTLRRAALAAVCMFAARLGAQGTISGVVRDSAGRPVSNAQVSIDALGRAASADSSGHYRLDGIAAGMRLVSVRRIGYEPTSRMVPVRDTTVREANFVMERLTVLDSVVVKANGWRDRLVADIDERRRMGFGYFKDSIALQNSALMISVFADVPSVKVRMAPMVPGDRIQTPRIRLPGNIRSGTLESGCDANLWIDGQMQRLHYSDAKGNVHDIPDHDPLRALQPSDLALVEIYPRMTETPAQYIYQGPDLNQCGTVVIWTKRYIH